MPQQRVDDERVFCVSIPVASSFFEQTLKLQPRGTRWWISEKLPWLFVFATSVDTF